MSPSSSPPRLPLRLLRRLVPETVTGDLVEEYASKDRSVWWFWRQTMSLSYAYLLDGVGRAIVAELGRGFGHVLRKPALALGVVLLLGVAIGANTAMYGWIHHTLLAPLPYPQGERLVRVFQVREGERDSFSPPNFFDFQGLDAFSDVAGYWSPNVTLTGTGEAEKLLAATVSHDFFPTLGVEPRLGRGFTAEDDEPGAPLVAILGHGLWQRRFGGEVEIVGEEIRLDDRAVRIIGVAPDGFDYPVDGTEIWVPLRLARTGPDRGGTPYRAFRILSVVARLAPGVSIDRARASAAALAAELAQGYPESNRGLGFEISGLHEETVAEARAPLLLLFSAMGAVLLVACANVGGLLLARTTARKPELALRMSLGASSFRVFGQLVAEGVALALASGVVGLVLAHWTHRVIGIPVHPSVLLFLSALVVGVTVFVGLGPAFFGLRGRWTDVLRQGARVDGSAGNARARTWLVVSEIAIALLLLVTASLLLRSFDALRRLDRGFRDDGVYVARIDVPIARYRENHRRVAYFEALVERLSAGIERASLSLGLPLDPRAEFFVARSPFTIEGKPAPRPGEKPEAGLHVVAPGFFDVLSVPIVSGRDFDARDDAASPSVVIVNETMARRFWPGEDPVGRYLTHDLVLLPEDASNERRVIGVAADFRYYELRREPEPQMYVPFAQTPWPQMHLVVRTAMSLEALHGELGRLMRALDADVPVPAISRFEDVTARAMSAPRERAFLVTSFAVVALVLAALGLYAVMAYSVLLRTHEIGIRVALGARRNAIVALVLRRGLELSIAGALVGGVAALMIVPYLRSFLFGVTTTDPWSYAGVALTLIGVATLATYIPARRAASVDPIVALRAE